MATVAKFKFDDRTLSWALEQKLIFKYGFHTFKREPGEYVILEKIKIRPSKVITVGERYMPAEKPVSRPDAELSELDLTLLRRQLSAVVAMFLHPEQNLDKIKVRLNNIKQVQPPGKKTEFVEEWVKNFLEEIGDR